MLVFVDWFSRNEENIVFNMDVRERPAFLF
jgi:hypothetical protein